MRARFARMAVKRAPRRRHAGQAAAFSGSEIAIKPLA
jgi:hypothetical protein